MANPSGFGLGSETIDPEQAFAALAVALGYSDAWTFNVASGTAITNDMGGTAMNLSNAAEAYEVVTPMAALPKAISLAENNEGSVAENLSSDCDSFALTFVVKPVGVGKSNGTNDTSGGLMRGSHNAAGTYTAATEAANNIWYWDGGAAQGVSNPSTLRLAEWWVVTLLYDMSGKRAGVKINGDAVAWGSAQTGNVSSAELSPWTFFDDSINRRFFGDVAWVGFRPELPDETDLDTFHEFVLNSITAVYGDDLFDNNTATALTDGSASWDAYGSNTIVHGGFGGQYMYDIAYQDDLSGAKLDLTDAKLLADDLAIGTTYRIWAGAIADSGVTGQVIVNDGVSDTTVFTFGNTIEHGSAEFTVAATGTPHIRCEFTGSPTATDEVHIGRLVLREVL